VKEFTNVYVKDLSPEIKEEDLPNHFGQFGQIKSAVIMRDEEGKSKGFAFINSDTADAAGKCVDEMNGKEVNGKTVYVGRAQKKAEREAELKQKFEQLRQEQMMKYQGVNLYVKNLDDDMDDDKLRGIFDQFGTITSCKVMRDGKGNSKGFGFVCYTSPEEATKAVTEMNGKIIGSKPLFVALAQRKDARRAQLEARHQAHAKMGGVPGPQMGYPPQGPMFYQQPRGFMYPPMGGGRGGWMGPMPGGPMGVQNRGDPRSHGQYSLMPVPGQGRGGPSGMPNGAGSPGNRGPRAGPGGPGGMPQGARGPSQPGQGAGGRGAGGRGVGGPPSGPPPSGLPAGAPGIRYNDNVRNTASRPAPSTASSDAPEPAVAPPGGPGATAPLTIKALAAAPEKQKKQLIGEQLFPLIKAREPNLAGKITGMLLEMDNGELIHLLESPAALGEKIAEALAVLQAHESAAQEGEEEETE